MLNDSDMALVRRLPLFANLPAEFLSNILEGSMPRDVAKGMVLFHRDDPADCFFVVMSGWIKVFRETADGDEAVLGVFTRGETLAEAATFLEQGYPATAQVAEDARVLPILGGGFRSYIRSKPEIALNMLASMSKHLHGFVMDVEQLKTSSATQRVVEFLLKLCSVDEGSAVVVLPYDKTLISRRLGMQPESLSRILAKLRKQGVLTEQNRVVINDVSALHEYCQVDPMDFQASASC
jgi:CRP/FNR family transcriptional regulator, dissimilatory nitrate respiration regulator